MKPDDFNIAINPPTDEDERPRIRADKNWRPYVTPQDKSSRAVLQLRNKRRRQREHRFKTGRPMHFDELVEHFIAATRHMGVYKAAPGEESKTGVHFQPTPRTVASPNPPNACQHVTYADGDKCLVCGASCSPEQALRTIPR